MIRAPLYEPVVGVFHTQHSHPDNKRIAEDGLVLLSEIGSTMHGVSASTTDDDIDEMGICIEPPLTILGLSSFEQYEYRSKKINERSGAGDIDRVIYGLKKFVKLAAGGNPTVLMPLFSDRDLHIRYIEGPGVSLRDNRDMFITKQAGRKFMGYLDGQRKRYLDPNRQDSKHASRPELIEQFGWDTKTGYHALRLAIQGEELMEDQTITLPMKDGVRTFLLKVRNGEYSKENVTAMLDEVFIPRLKESIENSTLPDKPDMERINNWLTGSYTAWWRWKGLID